MSEVRVAVVGCGSVSEHYLPTLKECRYGNLVAVCDVIRGRAERQKERFGVLRAFSTVDSLLCGVEFDLLVNLTSMPAHYEVNRAALTAGKHVFSEKPFAPTHGLGKGLVELARERGVELWAAPNVVTSPQFRCLAEIAAKSELGKVCAAHACYGHGGPSWGPWFYGEGGGCLGDLAVYNITTLTGLLGPARAVAAFVGTVIRERRVEGRDVPVTADDNVMLLMDHGDAVFSHVQTGFVYGGHNADRTVELIGTKGAANLLGWDWEPHGVQVRVGHRNEFETRCEGRQGYLWQSGAVQMVEHLATGKRAPVTIEHALHVVEIMEGAYTSAASGNRVAIRSEFPWPLSL